jgi:hypothetical protein
VVVDAAGAVDVTYLALAHGRIEVLLARSTMQGVRFEPPQRVTSQSFNPMQGGSVGGGKKAGALGLWWIGDYQGLATGGGLIHPFWNDTRTGRLEIFTAAIAVSTM